MLGPESTYGRHLILPRIRLAHPLQHLDGHLRLLLRLGGRRDAEQLPPHMRTFLLILLNTKLPSLKVAVFHLMG